VRTGYAPGGDNFRFHAFGHDGGAQVLKDARNVKLAAKAYCALNNNGRFEISAGPPKAAVEDLIAKSTDPIGRLLASSDPMRAIHQKRGRHWMPGRSN
jgi:hypothetical protein